MRKPYLLRFGGSKIEPKWHQNCFKIASASKFDPKLLLRGYKIAPRSLLGASGAPKKLLEGARGGPRGNLEIGFIPPQNRHPRGVGGVPRSAPLGFGALFLEIAARASTGCNNRGSRVLGGHSRGRGEKLKLLQTTSKLVVLKLRCAKLEAPHAERGRGHTTARPVGRRIQGATPSCRRPPKG